MSESTPYIYRPKSIFFSVMVQQKTILFFSGFNVSDKQWLVCRQLRSYGRILFRFMVVAIK